MRVEEIEELKIDYSKTLAELSKEELIKLIWDFLEKYEYQNLVVKP